MSKSRAGEGAINKVVSHRIVRKGIGDRKITEEEIITITGKDIDALPLAGIRAFMEAVRK